MKKLLVALLTTISFGSLARALPAQVPDEEARRVERFRSDVRAFATDLRALRHVSEPQARRVAYVAVGEAYRYDIPVPLVLGILLIENWDLDADAISSAGAVGLMQVMPSFWRPVLGPYFGFNLFDEATNIRYGVWIVAHYIRRSDGDIYRALLRYNGCVKGTNTPNCQTYPAIVKRRIERYGRATCPERSFEMCVVRRMPRD